MRIVLFSSLPFVDGSGQPQSSDDRLLSRALTTRGAEVSVVAWESEASLRLPGDRIDLALLRSTWNAHLTPEDFLAWMQQIEPLMPLSHALSVVRWNLSKSVYLRDLAQAGFPVIPTIWLHPGERRSLSRVLVATGWRQAVLKPDISANSFGTCLFTCEHEPMQVAQLHLNRFLQAGRRMMLQPYLPAVEDPREHSYVFVGGSFSHAFSKTPFGVLSPGKTVNESLLMNSPEDETLLASCIMRWVEGRFGQERLLCGRIDLVRDQEGALRVMEVELISPLLHLEYGSALHTLVDLILSPGSGCTSRLVPALPSLPIRHAQKQEARR